MCLKHQNYSNKESENTNGQVLIYTSLHLSLFATISHKLENQIFSLSISFSIESLTNFHQKNTLKI